MRQGTADLPTRGHVLAYIGPSGEPIFDGDTIRVQDGIAPGGIPLAPAAALGSKLDVTGDGSEVAAKPSIESFRLAQAPAVPVVPNIVPRKLVERLEDAVNVLDCTDATDSSPSQFINRAILKASKRTGGQVIVPNIGQIYLLNEKLVLLGLHTFLEGSRCVSLIGIGRPTLRLANNINDTVIEGVDYLTLTGTNSGAGVSGFALRNLIIDGNRANNTTLVANKGHGIAIYGRDFIIEDVYVKNVARRGLHTEYGNTEKGESPFNGRVINFTTSVTGEEGWYNQVSDLHAFNINIRSPSQNESNAYDGIFCGSPGSIRGANINVWRAGASPNTHRYSLNVSGACVINGAHLETAATANLRVGGGTNNIKGFWGYNMAAGAIAGVIIEGNNNFVDGHYNPSSAASTACGLQIGREAVGDTPAVGVSGNVIQFKSTSALGGTVKFAASNGSNSLHITDFLGTAGALGPILGTPHATDQINHVGSGSIAGEDCRFGRATAKGGIGIGRASSASATDALAIGQEASASSFAATAIGHTVTASQDASLAIGNTAQAGNAYAHAVGNQARSFNTGEISRAVGRNNAQGDHQIVEYIQWASTTNATPVALATVVGGQITVPTSTLLSGRWTIIGARSDGAVGTFKALIDMTARRGTTGAATLPENTKTQVVAFTGATGVDVTLAPDGAAGRIVLTATGADGIPIEWHAAFSGTQVRW